MSWIEICAAAELDHRPRRFQWGAFDLLMVRVEGVPRAIDNVCTHAFACLHEGRVRGARVICPLHGGSFDLRTGAALGLPAVTPLTVYEVRELAGMLAVRLPDAADPKAHGVAT